LDVKSERLNAVSRELEQLVAVLQPGIEVPDGVDDIFELLLFLAEFLGPLLIVPDLGILEFLRDDGEALRLDVEVKDTSAARPCGASGRRAGDRALGDLCGAFDVDFSQAAAGC